MFSGLVRGRDHPDLMAAAAESFLALRSAVASSLAPSRIDETTVAAWAMVHGLAHLLIDGQLPPQMLGKQAPGEVADAVLTAWAQQRRE